MFSSPVYALSGNPHFRTVAVYLMAKLSSVGQPKTIKKSYGFPFMTPTHMMHFESL